MCLEEVSKIGNMHAVFVGQRLGKLAAAVVALLLVLAMVATAGCGKADEAPEEERLQEELEEGEEETGVPAETGDGEAAAESVTGGNTDFSLEKQEIGEGGYVRDLRITDIWWADHGDYFRIVFGLEKSDGSPVTEVPNCCTFYPGSYDPASENFHELFIFFEDIPRYQFDYAPFQADDTPVSLGDDLIETMEGVGVADTEQVRFRICCSYSPAHPGVSSRPHRLMYATNPMRVILDLQKM